MKLLKSKTAMNVGGIIALVIGMVIVVSIIPIVITTINDTKSNYSSTEQVMLGLVSLLLVVGIVWAAFKASGVSGKK
jgi:uncharacterized protein YqhQ